MFVITAPSRVCWPWLSTDIDGTSSQKALHVNLRVRRPSSGLTTPASADERGNHA